MSNSSRVESNKMGPEWDTRSSLPDIYNPGLIQTQVRRSLCSRDDILLDSRLLLASSDIQREATWNPLNVNMSYNTYVAERMNGTELDC